MKRKIKNSFRQKSALNLLIIVLALFLTVLAPPAAAEINWDVSPTHPAVGDILVISGTAAPNEKINAQVSFEKEIPVSRGRYMYVIDGVEIPEGKNIFTVRAEGVNDLNVRVKTNVWVTLSTDANNGIASISQSSVPPGTYKAKIDGTAQSGKSSVDLKITASQPINAGPDGNFIYSYNTSSIPEGNFTIVIENCMRTITLSPEKKVLLLSFDPSIASLCENLTLETEIIANTFPYGLENCTLNVEIEDPEIAEIIAVTFPEWADGSSSELPASSVSMTCLDTSKKIESGAENIVLGNLALFGKKAGKTNISITVTEMTDDWGDPIKTIVLEGSLEVSSATSLTPLPGYENPPLDLNEDGIYEDVTGNGIFNFIDLQQYFYNILWMVENYPAEKFDFNGNERIDFNDLIRMLFTMYNR